MEVLIGHGYNFVLRWKIICHHSLIGYPDKNTLGKEKRESGSAEDCSASTAVGDPLARSAGAERYASTVVGGAVAGSAEAARSASTIV
jgi:hypothetical protein